MTNPRRTPFRPPGRMLAVVLSVAVVAMASPALADPADTDSTSASSGSGAGALAATAAAGGPGSSAVTLVTGDRVAFTGVDADVQVTGVTPEVSLIEGKVLDDGGSGRFDWILAGMD